MSLYVLVILLFPDQSWRWEGDSEAGLGAQGILKQLISQAQGSEETAAIPFCPNSLLTS